MFGKNIQHDGLVSSGCNNWKKALAVFGKQEMAQIHEDSVALKSYQDTSKHGYVAQKIVTVTVHTVSISWGRSPPFLKPSDVPGCNAAKDFCQLVGVGGDFETMF